MGGFDSLSRITTSRLLFSLARQGRLNFWSIGQHQYAVHLYSETFECLLAKATLLFTSLAPQFPYPAGNQRHHKPYSLRNDRDEQGYAYGRAADSRQQIDVVFGSETSPANRRQEVAGVNTGEHFRLKKRESLGAFALWAGGRRFIKWRPFPVGGLLPLVPGQPLLLQLSLPFLFQLLNSAGNQQYHVADSLRTLSLGLLAVLVLGAGGRRFCKGATFAFRSYTPLIPSYPLPSFLSAPLVFQLFYPAGNQQYHVTYSLRNDSDELGLCLLKRRQWPPANRRSYRR